ncbi:Regulating synaptic membrane exocytosis protein 2 [Exaiptasia diaphana]|nr:Regulating synaptic membrane exocytosis protein 2 [Exaiptasia diaphana]
MKSSLDRLRRDLRLEIIHLEERLSHSERTSQDVDLCKICFKAKVADCLSLQCKLCQRKTCSRCGVREVCEKQIEQPSKSSLQADPEPEYLSLPVDRQSIPRDCDSVILSVEDSDCCTSAYFSPSPTPSPTPSEEFYPGIHALNMAGAIEYDSPDSSYSTGHPSDMTTHQGRPIIERLTLTKYNASTTTEGLPFGTRIVGGKMSDGVVIGAYVTQINPSSKASTSLNIGDQIIEWNNISLVDSTFEETQEAINSSPNSVTLVVGHIKRKKQTLLRPSSSQIINDAIEKTRANFAKEGTLCLSQEQLLSRLEKNRSTDSIIKEQALCNRYGLQSRIHISLWHDPERNNLIIKIIRAQSLSSGASVRVEYPNPYAVVNLLPRKTLSTQFKTNVEYQSVHPIWNLTFIYSNITKEELLYKSLEVSLWSERSTKVPQFIGAVFVELSQDVLSNIPQWYNIKNQVDVLHNITIPTSRRFTVSSSHDVINSIISTSKEKEHFVEISRTSRNVRSCIVRQRSPRDVVDKDNTFVYNKRRKTDSGATASYLVRSRTPSKQSIKDDAFDGEITMEDTFRGRGNSILSCKGLDTQGFPRTHSAPATPCGKTDFHPMFAYSPRFNCPFWQKSRDDVASCTNSSQGSLRGSPLWDKTTSPRSEKTTVSEERENNNTKMLPAVYLTAAIDNESNTSEASLQEDRKKKRLFFRFPNPDFSSESSYSFDDGPQDNETGPNQICTSTDGGQDLGYVRIGLVIENSEVLVVDIIRAKLLSFKSEQQGGRIPHLDTYVKTYLLNDGTKTCKRKSSTVRQDSNPVYNWQVKYSTEEISKSMLYVRIVIFDNHVRGRIQGDHGLPFAD